MQLTLAWACCERSKFGCTDSWQPRQVASSFFADNLFNCRILVTSPPEATCASPGPWQLSHVTPLPPCSRASFACGLVENWVATSAWQVAQTSDPTFPLAGTAAAFGLTAACWFSLPAASAEMEAQSQGNNT